MVENLCCILGVLFFGIVCWAVYQQEKKESEKRIEKIELEIQILKEGK